MLKRWMLLLVTGMLLTTMAGCGNKNQDSTEIIDESAVEVPAADSDSIQAELEKDLQDLPALDTEEAGEETAGDPADEEVVYEPAEISCTMPKGFIADADEPGLYIHKTYPKDISTISYVISESEEDVTAVAAEDYKAMLEADFMDAYGDEVNVNVTMYNKIRIDKRPALKIKLNYEFKGVVYEQLIYMIYNGTESHILSYTQEEGGKWMEAFEESGDSVKLVPTK